MAQSPDQDAEVSFSRDVRPILQANCFGCHQGARKNGGYLMTQFDGLIAGGESGTAAVVPGEPDASYLIELITPESGEAQMPPDGKPLGSDEIATITRWIEQGAVNDSPPRPAFDQDNPPSYARLPVVTSLAYSPDGRILATSGHHEVILLDAEDHSIMARLIGMSPRIDSFRFSPDGKFLAVAAGMPGEFGEIQVWDTTSFEQVLSRVLTHDTVYGVSWSPDGQTIAFGGANTALRAIDRQSGKQVLYQNAHEDWIRDTVFSANGEYLVSVGRDMTCKLTEVAEQRFVDNITSITPGVLKGGIASVARHPQRDEVLIGGADGIPKVYRLFRQTKRVIGDDANMIRRMPSVAGRIQSVDISNNGKRLAVGSSLDGRGAVHVFSYEFDAQLPDDVKAVMRKVVSQRTPDEKKKLESYVTKDVKQISKRAFDNTGIYAIAFHPNGQHLAVGGADGRIRIVETDSGQIQTGFDPLQTTDSALASGAAATWQFAPEATPDSTPKARRDVRGLTVHPESVLLQRPTDYVQLVVTAELEDGTKLDVTPHVETIFDSSLLEVTPSLLVQPLTSGQSEIVLEYGDVKTSVAVGANFPKSKPTSYVQDVAPILTRIGCNAGTCHGSASGKNGFKLSLRGYDPLFDIRALTDDMASRRVSVSSPQASLMLQKPTGQVPHQGGQVLKPGGKYYSILRQWIAEGATYDPQSARVAKIELSPSNPVMQDTDSTQQMQVVATFTDGATRDVTRESFIESADNEVATATLQGTITGLRRGESAILARYEGAFAATTLTVMGQRTGFSWQEPPANNEIDKFVASKWKRMKILPSPLTDDYEFMRRIFLDLTGLPPDSQALREFVADDRPTQIKRDELVDQLIASDEFVDHWTNKWADLLQVNRKYLGPEGAAAFRGWIRQQVELNTPYDQLVRTLLTSSGSNNENPAASYYKILRKPDDIMENTTHLFLATRFNCNKCHDHPFERWTQDQYYETAAFFARVGLKKDPVSKDRKIGGTAVEGAKPLYEIVFDRDQGEIKHDRTGSVTEPQFPFECDFESADDLSRRQRFANWLTSADNPYFAKSYVNRLWGYLLGRGLIEPIDDIRASNPPTNPPLLDYLTEQFIDSGFDVRHVIALICKSRTYQLSVMTNEFNADDLTNYSHALARRLPAEVLFDAIHFSVGSQTMIPGFDPGTRAAELPDGGAKLPSGFLATLGRPARESVCECDRNSELQLGSVLALVSGPDQARAIGDPKNNLAALIEQFKDDRELIDEIFMRVLNRPPSDAEISIAVDTFTEVDKDHAVLIAQRDERQKWVDQRLPELQRKRSEAIAAAQKDLDDYLQKTDPELPARETARENKIKATQHAFDQYNKDFDKYFAEWRARQLAETYWYPIVPTRISQTNGAKTSLLDDRSIRVLENKGKTVTEVIAETDLTAISAVRLEVLSDPDLPSGGPGLAENGNFVLTELTLEIASREQPDQWKPVKLSSAIADFDQANYPIVRTIDDKFDGGNSQGWAIVPQTGKSHWGVYELQLPIGYKNGSRLWFKLHQNYGFDNKHQIGRFRLSFARSDAPVGLSVSEELLSTLVLPPEQWDKTQRESLTAVFKKGDAKLIQLTQNLNRAKVPLKIDEGIIARREKLARVSRPIPDDSQLVQLISDVKHSEQQLANRRLTLAQDLAWALINSPSFLFNR